MIPVRILYFLSWIRKVIVLAHVLFVDCFGVYFGVRWATDRSYENPPSRFKSLVSESLP